MRRLMHARLIGLMVLVFSGASQAGGPLLIDHRLNYDNGGIWNSNYQDAMVIGVAGAVVAGALWEGADDRLGRTLWQSVDSLAFSVGTTEALKVGFSRKSPAKTSDPDEFFKGHGNDSFPSLHVAALSGALTPIMLEYGKDQPLVYGLAGLVAYEMVGRVKVQEHWQSDVLVSAVMGTAYGFYAHGREHPLIFSYLPGGAYIGLKKQF